MKTLHWALGIMLLLTATAGAQGLTKGQTELALGVGVSVPLGSFSDASTTGFAFDLRGGYYLNPQVALTADIDFNHFGIPDAQKISGVDVNWQITRGVVGVKYLFKPQNTSPYIKGGLGSYNYALKTTIGSYTATASQSDLGLAMGGGIQMKGQGPVGGFVELLYHSIFTEGDALTFFGLQGGVTFFLGGK